MLSFQTAKLIVNPMQDGEYFRRKLLKSWTFQRLAVLWPDHPQVILEEPEFEKIRHYLELDVLTLCIEAEASKTTGAPPAHLIEAMMHAAVEDMVLAYIEQEGQPTAALWPVKGYKPWHITQPVGLPKYTYDGAPL